MEGYTPPDGKVVMVQQRVTQHGYVGRGLCLYWGRIVRGVAALVLACVMAGGCAQQQKAEEPAKELKTWVEDTRPIRDLTAATTRPAELPEPVIIEEALPEDAVGPATMPSTMPGESVAVRTTRVDATSRKGTLIYPCRHSRPEVLKEAVEGLISPEGSIQASSALNTLVISDNLPDVKIVLRTLQAIDRPIAQLLVEARVVEVTVDSDLEYEIEHLLNIARDERSNFFQDSALTLKTPGPTPTLGQGAQVRIRPWASNGSYLQQFVRLLVTKGKAKILSSPNLLVAPGSEASIITGEEVPIQSSQVVSGSLSTTTQFKRVGIKLRVSLLQLSGDTARLEIQPEVSTVTRFTETAQGVTNPIIAIRNVSSTLQMKDGEVLTVGGLLSDVERHTKRGIPGLMDVPGVGMLFQSRRDELVKTQLIFFMRIHILDPDSAGGIRVHRPGAGMEDLDRRTGMMLPKDKDAAKGEAAGKEAKP